MISDGQDLTPTPISGERHPLPVVDRKRLLCTMARFGATPGDFCLTGGVAFFVWGLRQYRDIDVSVTTSLRDRLVQEAANNEKLVVRGTHIRFAWDQGIEINREDVFHCLGISDDDLVTNSSYHVVVDGIKVVRIELQYARKAYRCTRRGLVRCKDITDVLLVEQNLKGKQCWEPSLARYPQTSRDRVLLAVIRRSAWLWQLLCARQPHA